MRGGVDAYLSAILPEELLDRSISFQHTTILHPIVNNTNQSTNLEPPTLLLNPQHPSPEIWKLPLASASKLRRS